MDSLDVVVIGAGVVGLAVARALARDGREVMVLERRARIGEETSSQNSEVIHAGIHYPPNSLKARLCVRGKKLLYEYCREKSIDHPPLRKTDRSAERYSACRTGGNRRPGSEKRRPRSHRARPGGCSGAGTRKLRCTSALLSPSTGSIDSHGLMMALRGDLERAGGHVSVLGEFVNGRVQRRGISLEIRSAGEPVRVRASTVINAAGLYAADVAGNMTGLERRHIPRIRYAKGNYFVYRGQHPFRRPVYPLPEPGGLGIHVSMDLNGQARFGPDVQWIEAPEYTVDESRLSRFVDAIRTYWPGVNRERLAPGYAGVRPKLVGPGEPAGDFVIQGADVHRVAGLVNLYGIESPGLTASLAIAEQVAASLG